MLGLGSLFGLLRALSPNYPRAGGRCQGTWDDASMAVPFTWDYPEELPATERGLMPSC